MKIVQALPHPVRRREPAPGGAGQWVFVGERACYRY